MKETFSAQSGNGQGSGYKSVFGQIHKNPSQH